MMVKNKNNFSIIPSLNKNKIGTNVLALICGGGKSNSFLEMIEYSIKNKIHLLVLLPDNKIMEQYKSELWRRISSRPKEKISFLWSKNYACVQKATNKCIGYCKNPETCPVGENANKAKDALVLICTQYHLLMDQNFLSAKRWGNNQRGVVLIDEYLYSSFFINISVNSAIICRLVKSIKRISDSIENGKVYWKVRSKNRTKSIKIKSEVVAKANEHYVVFLEAIHSILTEILSDLKSAKKELDNVIDDFDEHRSNDDKKEITNKRNKIAEKYRYLSFSRSIPRKTYTIYDHSSPSPTHRASKKKGKTRKWVNHILMNLRRTEPMFYPKMKQLLIFLDHLPSKGGRELRSYHLFDGEVRELGNNIELAIPVRIPKEKKYFVADATYHKGALESIFPKPMRVEFKDVKIRDFLRIRRLKPRNLRNTSQKTDAYFNREYVREHFPEILKRVFKSYSKIRTKDQNHRLGIVTYKKLCSLIEIHIEQEYPDLFHQVTFGYFGNIHGVNDFRNHSMLILGTPHFPKANLDAEISICLGREATVKEREEYYRYKVSSEITQAALRGRPQHSQLPVKPWLFLYVYDGYDLYGDRLKPHKTLYFEGGIKTKLGDISELLREEYPGGITTKQSKIWLKDISEQMNDGTISSRMCERPRETLSGFGLEGKKNKIGTRSKKIFTWGNDDNC